MALVMTTTCPSRRSTIDGITARDFDDAVAVITGAGGGIGAGLAAGFAAEAFGGEPQCAQTLIGVSALAMPDLLIEIKCIVHV